MQVFAVIFPVVLMIGLGVFCRGAKLLSHEGVSDIKRLVMSIMLPVAIFHALGSADYGVDIVVRIAVMLGAILLSFGMGFLLRPLIKEPYRKYVPFLVSVYEGGMIGYPLYTSLCGTENLSQIALLDVACLLFGFGVYMGLLQKAETGARSGVKEMLLGALKTPAFVATVLGIIAGATGGLGWLIASPVGEVYLAAQNIVTVGMSALILLVIGYDLSFSPRLLGPCLATIVCRIVVQSVLAFAVVFLFRALFGADMLRDLAVILLMASPAPFSMQSFLTTEEGSRYVSTVNSLYCLVTVAVYIVLACIV